MGDFKQMNLLSLFKKNSTRADDYARLVQLISVGIYADKEVKEVELDCAKEIIEKEVNKEDISYVNEEIKKRVNKYEAEEWFFQLEEKEIVEHIIDEHNWNYAEYLVRIIKSDNMVTAEEYGIIGELSNLVEKRKMLLHKLNINKN